MSEDSVPPIDWKFESQRFDGVADLYDRYRPGYPAQLIEDILVLSDIQPDGRILEIGSGTGKATLLFAQKGYRILGLEPGQNLIEVARNNLASYPGVSFVRERFEDWDAGQDKFDLVFSAQAYHWVPEEVRYERTASVLKPRAHLAVFWNMYPGLDGEIRKELDRAYLERAPELVKPVIASEQLIKKRANSLRESPYFENVVVRTYPWSIQYETGAYLRLLNTYSDHLRLSEQRRAELFKEIAGVIDRFGGFIERPYLAVVYIAQRSLA